MNKKIVYYSFISLMNILAIVGWQQANALNQEMAVRELALQERIQTYQQQVTDYQALVRYNETGREAANLEYERLKANPIIQDREVIKKIIMPLESTTSIDLDYILSKLTYAEYSHQFYVDNPWAQASWTGNTTWNQEWVEIYQRLYSIITEIKEKQ